MGADHADDALHSCYHDDQQLPVLRADTAFDKRRAEPQHGYDYVLHLLQCV